MDSGRVIGTVDLMDVFCRVHRSRVSYWHFEVQCPACGALLPDWEPACTRDKAVVALINHKCEHQSKRRDLDAWVKTKRDQAVDSAYAEAGFR